MKHGLLLIIEMCEFITNIIGILFSRDNLFKNY